MSDVVFFCGIVLIGILVGWCWWSVVGCADDMYSGYVERKSRHEHEIEELLREIGKKL